MTVTEGDDGVGYKKPPRSTRYPVGVSGNPKGRPNRLLKKSVRLRNEECKRDFLRLDAAQVRSFGVKSGRCSLALHVAGRASPLGAKSLGRRTML